MRIQVIPTSRLIPYASNPRKIPPKAVDKVAASIAEFGFQQPIVVDESCVVVVGHTRLLAAQKLGLDEVPVKVAEGLTDAQVKAYRLADNRTNQEALWDLDLLGLEFEGLEGFDLSLTGFDMNEIDSLVGPGEGLTAEDEAPEAPEDPVSRPGDVWLCGAHRVLCGDATVASDVDKLLAGAKPLLMVTDPPYGVEYDPDWRNRADRANGKPYGASAVGTVTNDHRDDWREAWALFPGNVAYVWHAGTRAHHVAVSIEETGFDIRAQIVWAKHRHVISRGAYHGKHEPCWYAVRKGSNANWKGDRKQSTLWTVEHQKSDTGHGTQKPVEVMRRPILNHTVKGGEVYDPFLGSGTTMIAAETTGRACYGIEISPAYVDVIVKRWQSFTGLQATHATTGEKFPAIKANGSETQAHNEAELRAD